MQRQLEKLSQQVSKGYGKGGCKTNGKAGAGGKDDGKGRRKVPCMNQWCTAMTWADEADCFYCYAPLFKNGLVKPTGSKGKEVSHRG
jgi:hypothetical protein